MQKIQKIKTKQKNAALKRRYLQIKRRKFVLTSSSEDMKITYECTRKEFFQQPKPALEWGGNEETQ